MKKDLIEFNS